MEAVVYPAESVGLLAPSAGEAAALASPPPAGALALGAWGRNHLGRYLRGLAQGVDRAVARLEAVNRSCPGTRFLLVGYSQGAMVMHQAMARLAAQRSPALARIEGAVLVADGDRQPHAAVVRWGTSPARGQGVEEYFGTVAPVPAVLADDVISVCDQGDFVCDFGLTGIRNFNQGRKVHTGYAQRDEDLLARAGEQMVEQVAPAATCARVMARAGTWGPMLGRLAPQPTSGAGGTYTVSFDFMRSDGRSFLAQVEDDSEDARAWWYLADDGRFVDSGAGGWSGYPSATVTAAVRGRTLVPSDCEQDEALRAATALPAAVAG